MEHLKTKSLTGVILFLFLAFSLESYANDGIRVPYNFYELKVQKMYTCFQTIMGIMCKL